MFDSKHFQWEKSELKDKDKASSLVSPMPLALQFYRGLWDHIIETTVWPH